ncbi:MAG: gamma-glutamylcyclotransferase family protein [Pseudomonadota bacterium]
MHPAGNDRCVVVYGTLRRGDDNDITRMRPAPTFVGAARLAGVMYHLGAYPGVVLGGSAQVVAEVYRIGASLEAQLDALEAVYPQQSDEYVKRHINVTTEQAGTWPCIVYEINPKYTTGAPVIPSGDWVLGR